MTYGSPTIPLSNGSFFIFMTPTLMGFNSILTHHTALLHNLMPIGLLALIPDNPYVANVSFLDIIFYPSVLNVRAPYLGRVSKPSIAYLLM